MTHVNIRRFEDKPKFMNILYRKLVSTDTKQYRDIRLESLKLYPENFDSNYEQQIKLPKLMFEQALEQPTDDRFVMGAYDQQMLVGICGFIPFLSNNGFPVYHIGTIIQMYVKSQYRGKKVGLNLVKSTMDEAFKIPSIQQIFLEVLEGNKSAIRVYEQAGFQTYDGEAGGVRMDSEEIKQMMVEKAGKPVLGELASLEEEGTEEGNFKNL